ncbi:hypothetical protein GRF29_1g873704 [Pseudopithomyces chartarum]|uniref:PEBP-like protein n=1 Tax=Pseudopithomyces chartarum TaxID=1892770 RepID=A0AAN6M6L1_9PLEO|nr:hypothetical protein GRF29_1g873704 [Pseudopithomyces chartarum]
MSQDRTQILREHKVIPDVLPEGTTLSHDLKVVFPEATLDTPGQELGREETQPEPRLFLDPVPQEKHNDYVLILTDPDLMSNNDQSFGQVRHWFTTNVSLTDNGELTVYPSPQYNISPYIGPAPLPNYLYSRPHRYIFILARPLSSTHPLSISAEDFEKLQEPFAAAFKGAQRGDVQDLKDRWGFDARRLCEEKGLGVEAVTFMRVGGTVRSAGANAVMMGEAVVDKVLGR